MNLLIENWPVALVGIPLVLLVNALLVACEYSLIKIRFSHFNPELRERVDNTRRLKPFLDHGDRTIRVIRLGMTSCLFLYALFSFPLLREWIGHGEMNLWGGPTPLAAVLAFLLAILVHQALGDLLPRALGLTYPLQALRAGVLPMVLVDWISRPFRQMVLWAVRSLWRIWRREPLPDLETLDLETQVELMRKESPDMSMVAQLILKNTLAIRELVVADVLLPRNQIKYFDLNLPLEDNLRMARETGHTRFPLCSGDLDRCVGLIHIKDIFRYSGEPARLDLRGLKRNMIRIDSEEPLESALTKLLSHRIHMALVIDEFHGTEGVLTLERILEQLVGEIRDEFDADEEMLIKSDEQAEEVRVSGLTPLHEIEAIFSAELEYEEVSTIGGLITSELGRIPEKGELLRYAGMEMEITEVDDTRVIEVQIRRAPQVSNAAEESVEDEGAENAESD